MICGRVLRSLCVVAGMTGCVRGERAVVQPVATEAPVVHEVASPQPGPVASVAPIDTDVDGFADEIDLCPDVSGVTPDGCPPPDVDDDGLGDSDDKCPKETESRNGYEDRDGCPDEVPTELLRLGPGIKAWFAPESARLTATARRALGAYAATLKQYPEVRIEIAAYSDASGSVAARRKLTQQQAEAIVDELVRLGVARERLQARGRGPDEPVCEKRGRCSEWRVEVIVLIR